MKKLGKKPLATILLACFLLQAVGCSSTSVSESTQTPSGQSNAGNTESTSGNDAAVLDRLEQCLEYGFGADAMNYDTATLNEALAQVQQALNEIDAGKCSQETRLAVEETKLLVNETINANSLVMELEVFSSNMEAIFATDVQLNLNEFTTMDEIDIAYGTLTNQVAQLEALECPQYFEGMISRLTSVYTSYTAVLADFYYANRDGDFMSYYSDLCIFEEILSELQQILVEIEELQTEFLTHLEVTTDKLTAMKDEISGNITDIRNGNTDVQFTYLEGEKEIVATVSTIETIYPAVYNNLNAVSILTLSAPKGEMNALVTVEIDGFSQKYDQTITLGMMPQRLYVKPAVLTTGINLDNQTSTQIKVTVSEVSTGNTLVAETNTVKIMSINDFILSNDEYGYTNYADILAWVTPESSYIQEVLRYAAINMGQYSGTEGIVGYQVANSEWDELNTTAYQVYAIQKAISDVGVRYVMSSYSIGEARNATQRVNRPDETLLSKSGICIETSVLLASVLQAAGFNSMIVLTTGHCQVAVETWQGSGEYILVETTLLPLGNPHDMCGENDYINTIITVLTNEEWSSYLANNNGVVYDCNMATSLGITPLMY